LRIYSDSILTGQEEELGMEEGNSLLRNAIAVDNTEGAYIWML